MNSSLNPPISGTAQASEARTGPRVRWLFLDLNSYFASVEQELQPLLRGRPVAVVPVMADTTCCIAASYEAKAFGVKTGTQVGEAKKMCPGLALVEARHELYVEYHHRIVQAVERFVPIASVMSIDEMACRLIGREQPLMAALDLAGASRPVSANMPGRWWHGGRRVNGFRITHVILAASKFLTSSSIQRRVL